MDMYILDNFETNEITDAIKYWVDVWDDLISNCNKNSYGLTFMSPHVILLDIVEEIELNTFKNKEVKKFYQRKIDEFVKNDLTIKSKFYSGFKLIRREFDGTKYLYMSQLCKEMLKKFKNGEFFTECFLQLKNLLLDSFFDSKVKEAIKIFSEQLIIELVLKGYSLKTIQKIPTRLFATYKWIGKNLVTDYPHSVKYEEFMSKDKINYQSFHQAIIREIDNLTIETRLSGLMSYFFKDKETYTYIFNIEGLIGIDEWYVGDVHFYSPAELTYIQNSIKKKKELHEEFFHGTYENHFINAAVQVEVLDIESSKIAAIEKVEKALDLIRCFYSSEMNFEIVTEEYYVVDQNGRNVRSSFSASKRLGWYKWQSSFQMDEIREEFFDLAANFLLAQSLSQSDFEKRVTQSLRWFRKAEEAPTIEDRLLSYWIVIENLVNVSEEVLQDLIPSKEKSSKFSLAKEVIASLNTQHILYRYGWELYYYLRNLTGSYQGSRKLLELADELIIKSGLNVENGYVDLQTFIQALDSLEQQVTREIIKDKIHFARLFYKNENQIQKTMLESWLKTTQDEMLLLYRLRNKIVHNAHYDYTILPFFVEKARNFAGKILRYAVHEYNQDPSTNLESLAIKALTEIKIMLERLNNNETLTNITES